jgi:ubiquinone/menaquinone biosynthesis C-methylase UbiE
MFVLMHHRWLQGDALNLPFPDDTFDAMTMGYGLRNVVDKERAIQEIFRVLKPGFYHDIDCLQMYAGNCLFYLSA